MTVSLDHADGRSTLRFERVLAHGRGRVWRAVTEPDELVQWFPSAVIYEPRAGAPMQFDFGGEHGIDAWPGVVVAWEPERAFAFRWGEEDVLRFELSDAEGGGTRLVFTHAFAHQPGKEARDGAGWTACFAALDGLLAGEGGPAPGDFEGRQGELAAQFGSGLVLEADGRRRPISLVGPYAEVHGRAAVAVALDGERGVLVVDAAGAALEDGVPVAVRAGTVADPGATLLTGVLRDPLAA
ncbi:MAG TPA: SRPBCC family protein [Baekduia sp.]|nr:SRPBCC family protein [Baekduia sp.]